ncbi:MAG: YggS family pyridoxal phosphate-dependent enzyme [Flavobacteriales bacterium]|nr:YggS family pyridoxal phosphate-dependent enzyme [Crocinitomicaceae bacterium]NBX79885.1 YggS family pyridoxal phosphate-dependent enzyme [Flavobacteriales bacterium]NCA19853.1 YggS family pyridoxal phosphate-dependent enzyme [Crocinitomicaceae bacterium]
MIAQNLARIKATIPSQVCLVAVSKTKPVIDLEEAYDAGQRHFGENKVQELCDKYEVLPKDICWHLIGHLQTNKVKYIASFVHLIHSVDSLKLLAEIDKQAQKNKRVIDVLLQFHIAQEETKFGLNLFEANELLFSSEFKSFKNIRVVGVMGMASFTEDVSVVHAEFASLKGIFQELKNSFFKDDSSFKEISMGMSGDYELAIEEGSTIVRVGSSIFGGR